MPGTQGAGDTVVSGTLDAQSFVGYDTFVTKFQRKNALKVLIGSSPDEVARLAATAVLEGFQRYASDRAPVLGLATGSSPLGLYSELADYVAKGELNLSQATGFALDEYVGLPSDHVQSYRQTLVREVCQVMGLPEQNLNVPLGDAESLDVLEEAATAYDAAIAAAGGVDVQILGIGSNGHIGFNEPGTALRSRTHVTRLTARTRSDNARFFGSLDEVPTHSVTQGLGTVLEARRLVLVATGRVKAGAIAAAIEGPLAASCPASVLQLHEDAILVIDEEAANDLKHREYYEDSAKALVI